MCENAFKQFFNKFVFSIEAFKNGLNLFLIAERVWSIEGEMSTGYKSHVTFDSGVTYLQQSLLKFLSHVYLANVVQWP